MRRRFGRRRRSEESRRALDVTRELDRTIEKSLVPLAALEAVAEEEVPPTLAAVGTGSRSDGQLDVVAVSPESGSAAWVAGAAVALRRSADGNAPATLHVVSPRWRSGARSLLGALGNVPFEVRAVATAGEADGPALVEAERASAFALSTALSSQWALASEASGAPRWVARATAALQGLAAKHGGVLHRERNEIRLILLGQPVALLRSVSGGLDLEVLKPRRDRIALREEALSDAFDQLEGSLRKLLSDRKVRDSEHALRAREIGAFCQQLGMGEIALWPIGVGDQCPIDALGVADDGVVTAAVLRRQMTLEAVVPILESATELAPMIASLGSGVATGDGFPLRLAIGAEQYSEACARLLEAFRPAFLLRAMRETRSGVLFEDHTAVLGDLPKAPRASVPTNSDAARKDAPRERNTSSRDGASGIASGAGLAQMETLRLSDLDDDAPASGQQGDRKAPRRFEEISLFDLADDDAPESGGRRRRRRGGRGRSRNDGSAGADAGGAGEEATESRDEPSRSRSSRRRRRRRSRPLMVEDVADEDAEDEDVTNADNALELDESDGDDGAGDDEETDVDALQDDATSAIEPTPAPIPEAPPQRSRRRCAIVAATDREALGAALLLARDLRVIEGIWVYPQDDLMNFFRGVATDLREGTSIITIGFVASRETLQAASFYRGQLEWYDAHAWPPEDLEALRSAIGDDAVHVAPSAGSVLPLVMKDCTRRSRFSDKLLDLLTARFSPHDYERWGRLWWWRLGEIAGRSGDVRRELDPLLSGRPSDLARAAAAEPAPPLPAEAEFVAQGDFPLVHFGGYRLLRVVTPAALDPLLCGRIARERFGAEFAVVSQEGSDRVILVGDDAAGRRGFDLGAMADHLATKFDWVEALLRADHVTRIRISDLLQHPERLDELVSEVAMGRSVLEG